MCTLFRASPGWRAVVPGSACGADGAGQTRQTRACSWYHTARTPFFGRPLISLRSAPSRQTHHPRTKGTRRQNSFAALARRRKDGATSSSGAFPTPIPGAPRRHYRHRAPFRAGNRPAGRPSWASRSTCAWAFSRRDLLYSRRALQRRAREPGLGSMVQGCSRPQRSPYPHQPNASALGG